MCHPCSRDDPHTHTHAVREGQRLQAWAPASRAQRGCISKPQNVTEQGGHCGSSRDKKHKVGVPGQGAELKKRCPKKGNTTTSWRCAPRFLFPLGRTWRRQVQPDASS